MTSGGPLLVLNRRWSSLLHAASDMENLSETKISILSSCIIAPKSWSELSKITNVSDPTLTDHLKRLTSDKLLQRSPDDGLYYTTKEGLEKLKELPFADYRNIIPAKLMLAGVRKNLNNSDRLIRMFAELSARGLLGKEVESYYRTIADAVISSIGIQTHTEVKIDKRIYELVNELIGHVLKQGGMVEKGKLTITISVDFPKELDMRIRDESDPNIKQQLISNRDMIIDRTVANWSRLFSKNGLLA